MVLGLRLKLTWMERPLLSLSCIPVSIKVASRLQVVHRYGSDVVYVESTATYMINPYGQRTSWSRPTEDARNKIWMEEAKDQRERERAMKDRHDRLQQYNTQVLQAELHEMRTRFMEMEEHPIHGTKTKNKRHLFLPAIHHKPGEHQYASTLVGSLEIQVPMISQRQLKTRLGVCTDLVFMACLHMLIVPSVAWMMPLHFLGLLACVPS